MQKDRPEHVQDFFTKIYCCSLKKNAINSFWLKHGFSCKKVFNI